MSRLDGRIHVLCLARGETRIVAVAVAHLTRQETGTVEGTIKLVDLCHVGSLDIDGMEPIYPFLRIGNHHSAEVGRVHIRQLGLKVGNSSLLTRKRTCSGKEQRSMRTRLERQPQTGGLAF